MNRTSKLRFLSICLIIIFIISSCYTGSVEAKGKRGKLILTYKGKSLTLYVTKTNKRNSNIIDAPTLKDAKNTWADLKYSKKKSWPWHEFYCLKKGKTQVYFYAYGDEKEGDKREIGGYQIEIRDKKTALCGVKVGMSKKKTMTILRKQFDKNAVKFNKKDSMVQLYFSGLVPVRYKIKNGKVTSIHFFCS